MNFEGPYSWQCKELHRCSCHCLLAPLAMGDSGICTILTRYESMRLRSLCQSERTTPKDLVQHQRWTYPCYRVGQIRNINKRGCADGVQCLPNIWQKVINKGVTLLKVHECCTMWIKPCQKYQTVVITLYYIREVWLYWRYINFVSLWIKPCKKYRIVAIIFSSNPFK